MDYRDNYFKWAACQVMWAYIQRGEAEVDITMKDAFIKLFRGHDPLDCIKDFTLTTAINREEEIVEVTMSIPKGYGHNAPFRMGAWNNRKAKGGKLPELPKRVIFSGLKTIVFWYDGTKTIVSCAEDEPYDAYNAFCAALAKKMFGSTSAVKAYLKKNSEYCYPKVKKSKKPEVVVEYDMNCNCETMEVETVPRDFVECECESRSKPVGCEDCDSYVEAVPREECEAVPAPATRKKKNAKTQ